MAETACRAQDCILKPRYPAIALLVLTVYDDDQRIFRPSAPARGYLLKKTPPARLLESVKEALSGGAPMSPEVARRVVDLFRKVAPAAGAPHGLTPHARERFLGANVREAWAIQR